jgi:hypothetical protein
MKTMFATLTLAAILPATVAAQEVTYRKIRYDELGKYVVAQKGKVVVVEFWNAF